MTVTSTRATRATRATRRLIPTAVLAVAAVLGGCRGAAESLVSAPEAGKRADHLFGALASRFTEVERSPKFAAARGRLVRGALTPSRVFDDTVVWTGRSGATRTLLLAGALSGGRYRLAATPQVARPILPGEGRHVIALTRLREDEYLWSAGVDFSLGSVGAEHAGRIVHALLTSGDGLSEREIRAQYHAAFPRTTAALGLLATVDSLRASRLADGSTLLTLGILLHPDRVKQRFPAFGQYLERYVQTGRLRYTVRDASGAIWMRTDARDNRIRVQLRTHRGELAPLTSVQSAPRPIPDTLRFEGEIFAKAKMFTVGATALQVELVRSRGAGERLWTFRAASEPEWHLPLAAARLLRSPLRRPFEDGGMLFQIGFRDVDGTTVLVRRTEVAVKESAILRFLGRFGATVAEDFDNRVEREQYRFLREVFTAMGTDARALTR